MDQKEWTIMIYMAGDNNLAVDMAYALEQIKMVPARGKQRPNVFVYYDGNSPSIPTLYCDFSDPKRPNYQTSVSVANKLYPSKNRENENAADMNSVYNFIDWCVNKVEVRKGSKTTKGRRAKHYALILAGHSLGFQDIGLFRDEGSGKAMKLSGLKEALERVVASRKSLRSRPGIKELGPEKEKRETTVLLGKKLDILGFDSCVMGMLEVGYQFGNVAQTMIASEGSIPSAGWTYAQILSELTSGGSGDNPGEAVAERFVRKFIDGQDSFTIGGLSVDIAAWDLKKLILVARAFSELARKLIECFGDPESFAYRQLERAILQVHWQSQSYMFDQNVDLADFCELLDRECEHIIKDAGEKDLSIFKEIRISCQDVLAKLNDAVILSGFSGGGYQYSNGVSVFFPWSLEGYDVSRRNYESLWNGDDPGDRANWRGFLEMYLSTVSRRMFKPIDKRAEERSGGKYRYNSGVLFRGNPDGNADSDRLAGQSTGRLPGQNTTRMSGQQTTRLAGQQSGRLAGQSTGRMSGQNSSRMPGQQTTRLAGQSTGRLSGQNTTRLAGIESNQFFDFLRLFKNIESPWNVSGFSKPPQVKGKKRGK